MKFLRRRRDDVETAYVPDRYTAEDRGRALTILGDAVVLVRHPYERSPFSGSGNCWCGRHAGSSLHHVVLADGAPADPPEAQRGPAVSPEEKP